MMLDMIWVFLHILNKITESSWFDTSVDGLAVHHVHLRTLHLLLVLRDFDSVLLRPFFLQSPSGRRVFRVFLSKLPVERFILVADVSNSSFVILIALESGGLILLEHQNSLFELIEVSESKEPVYSKGVVLLIFRNVLGEILVERIDLLI